MSLLRLLAAGKSLMGLKQPRSRFEVSKQRLLPKFESNKNPFRATTLPEVKAEGRAPEPVEAPAVAVEERAETTVHSVAGELPEVDRLPFASQPVGGVQPSRRAKSLWERAGEKCRAKWPFTAEAKKPEPRPVQPELSLDLVRVVRNDLADGDQEIGGVNGTAARTLEKGAGAIRAIEKSARDFLGACKL